MIHAMLRRVVPLRTRNRLRLACGLHPIEYRAYYPDLEMMEFRKGDVVFDVGANVGRFIDCVLAYQPWTVIHAFEPLPRAFAGLTARLSSYDKMYLNNTAIGALQCETTLHVSRYDEVSSILEQNAVLGQRVSGHDWSVEESINVSVDTIANYMTEHDVERVRLLKLDVQGYELETLKGALPCLDRIDYIYAEAAFQPLYREAPLFCDLFRFLNGHRFELLRMTQFRTDDYGELLECDMIFANRGAKMRSPFVNGMEIHD